MWLREVTERPEAAAVEPRRGGASMACQRSVNIGDVSGQDGGRVSFSEIAGGGAAAKEGVVGRAGEGSEGSLGM